MWLMKVIMPTSNVHLHFGQYVSNGNGENINESSSVNGLKVISATTRK